MRPRRSWITISPPPSLRMISRARLIAACCVLWCELARCDPGRPRPSLPLVRGRHADRSSCSSGPPRPRACPNWCSIVAVAGRRLASAKPAGRASYRADHRPALRRGLVGVLGRRPGASDPSGAPGPHRAHGVPSAPETTIHPGGVGALPIPFPLASMGRSSRLGARAASVSR